MSYVVIDIETVPLAASMAQPYPEGERQPPAHYKNADAIDAWRERDRETWAQERAKVCSLSPRLGRVLCIGMADEDGITTPYARTEEEEATALETFWDRMALTPNRHVFPEIVTWNGGWDLRFLVVRSLVLGVELPVTGYVVRDWFKPYNTDFHTDLKRLLVGDGVTKGEGLDEWSAAFGIVGKTLGWTGASVYPAYLESRHAEIASYCTADVEATHQLYRRIASAFDWL
jgi:hypothetical protein